MFVLFLFLAIVGYYSWTRLAIDAYPDIADTTVQVVTQVPGFGRRGDRATNQYSDRAGYEWSAGTKRNA